MQPLRAWAVRHPRVVDGCLAGLVAILGIPSAAAEGMSGVQWVWVAAVQVPLVWRRYAPIAVFWAAIVLVGVSDMIGVNGAFQFFVPMFALYAMARYRPRRHLWPAVGAFEGSIGLAWWRDDLQWPTLVAGTAIIAATVLLGLNLRTRRAYLSELEERARRLERERDQQARLAVTAERTRIAREMHDLVAHHLAVMVALADGAALTATTGPARAAATMAKVSATGREALTEMRRLIGLLRDGDGSERGLADLDRLVDQVRAAGLRVTVTREGVAGAWGPGAGLAVYRIVQEALTNTLKHAGPRARAQVRLRYTTSGAELEVTDDGAGQAAEVPPAGGHGLAGMVERVAPYRGQVDAGPAPGRGWRVRARLHFDDGGGLA